MPQSTTITATDRDSGTHAFVPHNEDNGTYHFQKAHPDGIPSGKSTLSITLRESSAVTRARVKAVVPVVATETINGVSKPTVVRTAQFSGEFVFSNESITDEREALVGIVASLFDPGQALMDSVLIDLENLY